MNKTKLLTILSILLNFLSLNTHGYDYYDSYEEGDYEYEYIYEDDDCEDEDNDGYCDDDTVDVYADTDLGEPQFGDDETLVSVDLGNTARLTCTVHQLGSQVISWKRGDSFLFLGRSPLTNDDRYSVEVTDSSSSLTITLVTQEDAGDFKCQVATKEPMEQIFSIEIKGPPNVKILDKPHSGQYVLQEGSELRLVCEGSGDPRPVVSWRRHENSLQPPGLTPRHSASVDLQDISHTEAGTYQCVGNNGFGQPAIDSVQVIVKHKPEIYVHQEFVFNKEKEHVEVLKLICSVQAEPRAQTKWDRNDQKLPLHRVNQVTEQGKHILEIRKPRKSDAGVYTCQAANSEGEISGVLTVEDNEHLTETVEEFLEEVPEMIQDIQENSAATCQIPIMYLLSCFLLMIRGLQRL